MPKATNELKVGEEAPEFTLPSHLDSEITLSSYKGKKNRGAGVLPARVHTCLNAPAAGV